VHAQDITTGLLAYWALDGNYTDSSVNGRTGTPAGSPVFQTSGNCKVGTCLVCDGVDDRFGFTSFSTTTTWSMTLWLYDAGTPVGIYGALLTDATGANGVFLLSQKITFYYSGVDHLNTTATTVNTWTHIGLVVNAGAVQWYLNGVADGTATSAVAFTAAVVCNNTSSNTGLTGRVDEFRVFNRVLTQADVQAARDFTGAAAVVQRKRPLWLD